MDLMSSSAELVIWIDRLDYHTSQHDESKPISNMTDNNNLQVDEANIQDYGM